jgi:tetratricopeptide (TPR) repeat protein
MRDVEKIGRKTLKRINDLICKCDFSLAVSVADEYLASIPQTGYDAKKKELRYYFEDNEEFAVYIEMNRDEIDEKKSGIKSVIMMAGSASEIVRMKAYALFEMKRHEEAIDVIKHALTEINPLGRNLRFELVENYLKLGQLDLAENELSVLRGLVLSKQDIARLYRRLGFCKVEQGDHIKARICFQYSLWFEKSKIAIDEIIYIDGCIGEPWSDENGKEKFNFLVSGLGMGMCSHLAHEYKLKFFPTPHQFACAMSFLELHTKSGNKQMAEEYSSLLALWKSIMNTSEGYVDRA